MKDLSYRKLLQDKCAYEILLLRDQHNNPFKDIAKKYGITTTGVIQKYNKIKFKQIRLYINHISKELGYESIFSIRKVFDNAYEFYQDWTYACAYLENKYQDILIKYRDGEPGMPTEFLKNMPPFKPKINKKNNFSCYRNARK